MKKNGNAIKKQALIRPTLTESLVLSGLFLAIGVILPSLTGAIKEIGDSLLPMHLVVMLCGVICGWKYSACVGLLLPFIRSLLFSMPPIYPNAIWMALELMTYGLVIGIMFFHRKQYSRAYLLICLVCSMISGRIVWGITKAILLGIADKPFSFKAFWIGGFVDAIPGLIIQFVLIPIIIELLQRKKSL